MMTELDLIIIADYGTDSVSGSNPMKLTIDGQCADIQIIQKYLRDNGPLVKESFGGAQQTWASACHYNGIRLLDHLLKHGVRAALINDFSKERVRFLQLLALKPKLIALSTTFILDKKSLQRFHDEVRPLCGTIPLIVGGPFVYLSSLVASRTDSDLYQTPEIRADYLFQDGDDPQFDLYIISPTGEDSLVEAVKSVMSGGNFASVPNALTITRGEPVLFPPIKGTSTPLDTIDWQNLPDEIFASGVVPMQASRGCPFRCAFCNFVKNRELQTVRPVETIVEEMQAVEARGAKYIWFVDDIFRLGSGNLNDFSKAVISAGIDLQWMSFIRADTIKGVDFTLLKKSGCLELQLGLESASPEVLAAMNKKGDPLIYRQVIKSALQAGINISAYFIFGHPKETEASISRTIAFIQESSHPDLPGTFSWSFYPYLLVPLSPLFELEARQQFGLQGYMHSWSHQTMDSDQAMQQIKKVFMTLKDTGPIYRGDDLRLITALSAKARNKFYRLRHHFAQQQQTRSLTAKEIIEQFQPFF
ncbi:MAG: radical SAM protein [Desulfuromonadales bacterium]|nr:radical SAM protein [Desulfuromonadales bacterium]